MMLGMWIRILLLCLAGGAGLAWADAPAPPAPPASPPAGDLRQRLADRLASPEGQLKLQTPSQRLRNPVDAARARPKPPPPPPPKPWGYAGDVGPAHWGELQPEFRLCAIGTRQSPIDIRDTLKVDQEPIAFDYKPSLFSVLDTGRTLLISPDAGNSLSVGQRRYELQAIETRMPAEIRLNGERFDMALHLLHRDAEGRLAMLVLLMQRGDQEHGVLQRFWAHLPLEKQLTERASTPADLAQLLPASGAYFSFMGSLSTPPCTEGVLWLVMREPLIVSDQQLEVMRRLYPANARPVQPAGGRVIKESF